MSAITLSHISATYQVLKFTLSSLIITSVGLCTLHWY